MEVVQQKQQQHHHQQVSHDIAVDKRGMITPNSISPATSLSSEEDNGGAIPPLSPTTENETPPSSPSDSKSSNTEKQKYAAPPARSTSSSRHHNNLLRPGLLVSPEVMFGRLRCVSEAEDEGRYSQSSANESGWSEFADDDDTDQESDYDSLNTSNPSFVSQEHGENSKSTFISKYEKSNKLLPQFRDGRSGTSAARRPPSGSRPPRLNTGTRSVFSGTTHTAHMAPVSNVTATITTASFTASTASSASTASTASKPTSALNTFTNPNTTNFILTTTPTTSIASLTTATSTTTTRRISHEQAHIAQTTPPPPTSIILPQLVTSLVPNFDFDEHHAKRNVADSAENLNKEYDVRQKSTVSSVFTPIWEECVTDDGHRYFYNVTTGASQWEVPPSLSLNKQQQPQTPVSTPSVWTADDGEDTGRRRDSTDDVTYYATNAVSPTGGGKVIRSVKTEVLRIEKNMYAERRTLQSQQDSQQQQPQYSSLVAANTTGTTREAKLGAAQVSLQHETVQQQVEHEEQEDDRTDSQLHAAVSYGYVGDDHVKLLLTNGADPNSRDKNGGRTALHIAASGAYFAGMELLLDAGADPNVEDDDGNSAMHHACMGGCGKYAVDVVMYLHQTGGSNIGQANHDGDTPLHLASAIGDTACVEYLLQVGTHPEGPANIRGETPAHLAAGMGHMRVIEMVTDYGADVDALDSENRTPYDVAVSSGKLWCSERIAELPRRKSTTKITDVGMEIGIISESRDAGASQSVGVGRGRGGDRTRVNQANGRAKTNDVGGGSGDIVNEEKIISRVSSGNVAHLISSDSEDDGIQFESQYTSIDQRSRDHDSGDQHDNDEYEDEEAEERATSHREGHRETTQQLETRLAMVIGDNEALRKRIAHLMPPTEMVTSSPTRDSTLLLLPAAEETATVTEQTSTGEMVEMERRKEELFALREEVREQRNLANKAVEEMNAAQKIAKSISEEQEKISERLKDDVKSLQLSREKLKQQLATLLHGQEQIREDNARRTEAHAQHISRLESIHSSDVQRLREEYTSTQLEERRRWDDMREEREKSNRQSWEREEKERGERREQVIEEKLLRAHSTISQLERDLEDARSAVESTNRTLQAEIARAVHIAKTPERDTVAATRERAVETEMTAATDTIVDAIVDPTASLVAEASIASVVDDWEDQGTATTSSATPSLTWDESGWEDAQQPLLEEVESYQEGEVQVQLQQQHGVDVSVWSAWGHDASGWVAYTSDDGHVYYYNTETGISSWERPDGVPPVDVQQKQLYSEYGHEEGQEDHYYYERDNAQYYYNNDADAHALDFHHQPEQHQLTQEDSYSTVWQEHQEQQEYQEHMLAAVERTSEGGDEVEEVQHYLGETKGKMLPSSESPKRDVTGAIWSAFLENAAKRSAERDRMQMAVMEGDEEDEEDVEEGVAEVAEGAGDESRKDQSITTSTKTTKAAKKKRKQQEAQRKNKIKRSLFPLHSACLRGDANTLARLYSEGDLDGSEFDIDQVNDQEETPLHLAASAGHVECVRLLCESAADTNATNGRGDTALHIAASKGNYACVSILSEYGAPILKRNRDGETAEEKAISVTMFLQNPTEEFRLTVRHLETLRERGEERGGTPQRTFKKSLPLRETVAVGSGDSFCPLGSQVALGELSSDSGEGAWTFRGVLHTVGAYFGGSKQGSLATVDEDQATVAHLGESNRFYYDEELKRWVDPNEDMKNKNNGNDSEDRGKTDSIADPLVQSPSGRRKRGRSSKRPGRIELPPSDAMLGPTPPPSVTPRHGGGSSSTRSHSPSLEQLAFRATSPPAEVAMALAMANVDNGTHPHSSTPEDRPPGWSQRDKKAAAAAGEQRPKRNRFAMSQRKQGKLRSRYVDTFKNM
jgi:ankyrin repeat protein